MPSNSEPVLFGQYEVPRKPDGSLWELGHGGMGITYRAFDTKLRVEVVLKLIHAHLLKDERIQRLFLREARAAAKVRHPNIAAVVNLHDAPPFYYAMEFVHGKSLSVMLAARGALPLREALDYTDQIAAALGAMARERIVHRDLKPANLMLVPDEEQPFGHLVKVIDFGLAKGFSLEGEEDVETHLSSSFSQNVFSGTPYYASPEQCATEPTIDTRSDLYSLGVLLWEMLTGKRPFVGQLGQVLSMHQTKEPPWEQLVGVPEPVVAILRKLLAKERKDRFQTPRELREAISQSFGTMETVTERRSRLREAAPVGADPDATIVGTQTITLGSTLAERFRLGEEIASADGSKLFKAADNAQEGRVVALKLLPNLRVFEPNFIAQLEKQFEQMEAHPHSVILAPTAGVMRSGDGMFFTREWADGFSFLELIKARGELRAPEVWRLLQELPDALDHAATHQFALAEPLLRKLFICSPPGATNAAAWSALRSQPIESWPEFRLRWNAVSVPPASTTLSAATPTSARAITASEDGVGALSVLIRVLLGGKPGSLAAMPGISIEANAMLARALGPRGGTAEFSAAKPFWEALPKTPPPIGAPPGATVPPAQDLREVIRHRLAGVPRWMLIALGLFAILAIFGRSSSDRDRKEQAISSKVLDALAKAKAAQEMVTKKMQETDHARSEIPQAEKAREDAERAVPAIPVAPPVPNPELPRPVDPAAPAKPAEPFVNSLGMEFVPVTGVNGFVSIWETRVADFKAYCDAEAYVQTGGIHTRHVGKDAKGESMPTWSLDPNASWQSPGFKQGSDHPVVGVSWTEARAFCDWLTTRERKSGQIESNQRYRLPTDAEWTAAVGKSKYPWGEAWPPPKEAGNYLDKTAAEEVPGTGAVLPDADDFAFTAPTGSFEPNRNGLFDLGGNAWEFCEDEYRSGMNDKATREELPELQYERAIDGSPFRVIRGGSWTSRTPIMLRSAFRGRVNSTYRDDQTGFRVVLEKSAR